MKANTVKVKSSVVLPNGRKYNVGEIKMIEGSYGFFLPLGSISTIVRRIMKAEGINTSEYSIRSDSFAGGDSMSVSETAKTNPTDTIRNFLRNLMNQIQIGNFNGMIDLYEYKSERPVLISHSGDIEVDFGIKYTFFDVY